MSNIFIDPAQWSHEHIRAWLHWCQRKFSISHLDADVFPSSGHLLCSMSETDFTSLTGDYTSGIFLNCLMQLEIRGAIAPLFLGCALHSCSILYWNCLFIVFLVLTNGQTNTRKMPFIYTDHLKLSLIFSEDCFIVFIKYFLHILVNTTL